MLNLFFKLFILVSIFFSLNASAFVSLEQVITHSTYSEKIVEQAKIDFTKNTETLYSQQDKLVEFSSTCITFRHSYSLITTRQQAQQNFLVAMTTLFIKQRRTSYQSYSFSRYHFYKYAISQDIPIKS